MTILKSTDICRRGSFLLTQKGSWLIAFMIITFFLLNSAFSIVGKSLTYDEPYHYKYGVNILDGNSARFDDSKMPASAWNAFPAKIASFLPDGNLKIILEKMVTARLMTTLFAALVACFVFYWSRELYGIVPAWISLTLYAFDPNVIAHSQLITTDAYAMGTILISSYFLWKFFKTRHWLHGLLFSLMLGFSQLAKYTAISLYPLFLVIFSISDNLQLCSENCSQLVSQFRRKQVLRYLKYFLVVVVISIIVINIGFLFNRTFIKLSEYSLKSNLFQLVQKQTDFWVPTPYPYLEGLDWIVAKESTDLGFIHIYLLGETRFGEGFPGYYFIASALKLPIATQIILIFSFFIYLADKRQKRFFLKNEWFLLAPVFFYVIHFNFFYNSQMGIRYYLVIFPLLYVFAGFLFVNWQQFSQKQIFFTISTLIFLAGSVLAKYPNYLSYFNEFINSKEAYKYLADSNLEWGQDTYLLEDYKINHEAALRAPEIPEMITETSTYYVSINRLVGVIQGPENYRWLRENFEPVDMIGNSYLVYRITPDDMNHLCSTTSFCTSSIE
jgi:predicted nucleic acid-binding Zn ribbon protein